MKLVCRNYAIKECDFEIKFVRKWDVNRECGYELVKANEKHRTSCVFDSEESAFNRNKNKLMENKERIALIMLSRI